ncbi:secreted protein containing DUF1566 [Candidatus Thiomargarita nelsonii]|uniref:Secreted protein containing DUF1566 n=1 Tax=Candidatus Thiomargarita nelsonii TaxID=1003181 RepID=A0A176RS65_9GAMM|nr:secreted protein containing DUF1566 [Candidatus Thiomargarita nelsonii]
MPRMTALMLIVIGMILIPTLQAVEDEKVVKLLFCYDSPNSDYCLAEQILKLKRQIDDLKRQDGKLKQQDGKLKQQDGALESSIQAQQQTLSAQQETIQSLKDEIALLESKHGKLNEHVVALETTVKAQKKTLSAQRQTIKSLEDRVTTLENKLYRYIDNGDGTVTDNRTGLIWLKNANCFGRQTWKKAMRSVKNLATGQCGLSDGSRAGEWRLPTKDEWRAMTDKGYKKLALSNAAGTEQWKEGDAFSGVQSSRYWSSTTRANFRTYAWYVNFYDGYVNFNNKDNTNHVWAIRGGE